MREGRVRVVSNLTGMGRAAEADGRAEHVYVGDSEGAARFVRECLRADVVIVNADHRRLRAACLARWLLPTARFRLVAVDIVLRAPASATQRLSAAAAKLLLSRVDRFVFYFKRLDGYERHYGVGPRRAAFVPFKVNDWEKMHRWADTPPDGEYVMCAGRTMRDVGTFVEAVRLSGCPGLLHQQRAETMAAHGTRAWAGDAPPNLEIVVDESHSHEVFLDFIARARLVVVPRFRADIGPAGIATYLVAMALNKCVLVSEGPGVDDVLTDQAVIVPPEDPAALAREMRRLWDDDAARAEIAGRGRAYAMSLGGEERLLSDVLRVALDGAEASGGVR